MPEPLDPLHIEYATDKALADMHEFSDWLAGECAGVYAVDSEYEFRTPARMSSPLTLTYTLLHGAVTAALQGNVMMAGAALRLIAERYLAENRDRIARLASESAMGDKP